MQCDVCHEEKEHASVDFPNVCRLCAMLLTGEAPGVSGVSDGPGSASNEIVYNRPDRYKEIMLTLRTAEEQGKMKDPRWQRIAAFQRARAEKYKGAPKVDYEKIGGNPRQRRHNAKEEL